MNTAVVYFSQSGNTAKVGQAIAAALGPDTFVAPLDQAPELDVFDLVFVGTPVHAFGTPELVRDFLAQRCAGRRVALFVTHSAPDDMPELGEWLEACKAAAAGADLADLFHCPGVLAEPVRQHMLASDNPMLVEWAEQADVTAGRPNDADLEHAGAFAHETVSKVTAELGETAAV